MKRSIAFLLLPMLCLASPAFAQSPDWPWWRGPGGTGVSSESNWDPLALKDGAKVLWTADIGVGYSNIAIKDNRIYATGRDRKTLAFDISCLDAATGKVIWTNNTQRLGDAMSTLAVDSAFVYGLGNEGTVFCLRASDGRIDWKTDLFFDLKVPMQSFWATSPVLDGDLLFLNAGSAGIALKKKSGQLAWYNGPVDSPRGYFASPVLYGAGSGRTVLFFGGTALTAVQAASGKVLWSYTHGERTEVVADPIPAGDGVFFSQHDYGMLLQAEGNRVVPVWKNEGLRSGVASPVLVHGCIYGSDWAEYVSMWDWGKMGRVSWPFRCLDAKTGRTKWETRLKPSCATSAGGRLLVLEIDGILHIAEASADAYEEYSKADVFNGLKKPRLFTTPAVLLNGRIYCRNYNGELICIDMRS